MKNPSDRQSIKRAIRLRKHLKGFIKPLPRYGKAINAVVLLAFVMLVVAGAAALTVHNKPTPITTSPTNTTSSNGCLLSNSGCPNSSDTTTQPTQTAAPSTPTTTTPTQLSSNSSTSDCTQVVVPSTTTTYQDNSSLPQGQDETMSEGFPGFKEICNGVVTKEYPPTPGLVYVGTGTSSSSTNTEPPQLNLEPYPNPTPTPISVEPNGN